MAGSPPESVASPAGGRSRAVTSPAWRFVARQKCKKVNVVSYLPLSSGWCRKSTAATNEFSSVPDLSLKKGVAV